MKIRRETLQDEIAIQRLTTEAFSGQPHSSQTEAAIIEALRAADALTVSLVAEDNGIIGHVAFSPVKINGMECGWYGLGPVSVSPSRQGQGIGAMLIREGLMQLENTCAVGCVVLGSPHYYPRFGFVHDTMLTYSDAPAEYFMRLILRGQGQAGEVSYHPSFTAT